MFRKLATQRSIRQLGGPSRMSRIAARSNQFTSDYASYIADVTGQRLFSTTRPRQADVTLTIDGKEVTVPQGTVLLFFTSTAVMFPADHSGTALIQACVCYRLAGNLIKLMYPGSGRCDYPSILLS